MNGYEINILPYKLAKIYDQRTFYMYYFCLLRRNHLLFFTFYTKDDYNSRVIKINRFIFYLALYLTVNTLFFTDSTMHKIFKDEGDFDFIYQLPKTIYSSLICSAINALLISLALTENTVMEIKQLKLDKNRDTLMNKKINYLNCRLSLYFILNFMLLFIFWVYLSCFCAIYKNTQIHLMKETSMSLVFSWIYPFFISYIPAIFRIPSLNPTKKNRECLYNFSKVLQAIL